MPLDGDAFLWLALALAFTGTGLGSQSGSAKQVYEAGHWRAAGCECLPDFSGC